MCRYMFVYSSCVATLYYLISYHTAHIICMLLMLYYLISYHTAHIICMLLMLVPPTP